jgi:hypothetical protein
MMPPNKPTVSRLRTAACSLTARRSADAMQIVAITVVVSC